MEINSNRRSRRLLILDMLPSRELTNNDMDLQYLEHGKIFILICNYLYTWSNLSDDSDLGKKKIQCFEIKEYYKYKR